MNEFSIYFLKVNIALLLFYLVYRLFFNKDTHWKARRIYLLSAIVISFGFPFIPINNWLSSQEPVQIFIAEYVQLQAFETTTPSSSGLDVQHIIWTIYSVICSILLLRMLFQLFSIFAWKSKGRKQVLNSSEIIVLKEEITPFSFFRFIFMNPDLHDENEQKEILCHEKAHLRQHHSIDMIISELLAITCWINPAAWLLRSEIRQNLEFLADHEVIKEGYDSKEYQYHLLRLSADSLTVKFVNNFNISPLKNRITMMNKEKTSKAGLLKYSLVLPLTIALILGSNAQNLMASAKEALNTIQSEAFSFSKKAEDNEKAFTTVETIPEFKGGIDALMNYIGNNLKYPADAIDKGIEGKVLIRFIVTKEGKVSNAEVLRGIDPSCDAEALRVVEAMPDWIPGKQKGENVNVYYTLPISYKLGHKKEDKSTVKFQPPQIKNDKAATKQSYTQVEEMPKFPGGEQALMSYLRENIKYPLEEASKKIEGNVIVRFIVDKEGKVKDATVLRKVNDGLDAEALRVVNGMPDWIPGKQDGKNVNVYFTLPIMFKLAANKKTQEKSLDQVVVVGYVPDSEKATNIIRDRIPIQESKPLIVIDDIIQKDNFDLNSIKADDIESISVLKDASATAIYGTKGANGVILIKKKKK